MNPKRRFQVPVVLRRIILGLVLHRPGDVRALVPDPGHNIIQAHVCQVVKVQSTSAFWHNYSNLAFKSASLRSPKPAGLGLTHSHKAGMAGEGRV